jgi:adenosylhomocysteine nucleosidase
VRMTIGFVAAMKQEARPFLRAVGAVSREDVGGFPSFGFPLAGAACVLVKSGVGMRKAGEAAAALAEAVKPALIVSFGISGGAADDVSVGDLVIVTEVRALEGGALGPAVPLAAWPEAAREAVRRVAEARGARCVTAAAVTTRGETALPPGLSRATRVLALDMETSAVAAAAAACGTPLVSLRAISDTPSQPLPFEISTLVDTQGRLRLSRLLGAVIRRPRLARDLARTGRNMGTAVGALVAALEAALPALAVLHGAGDGPSAGQ